MTPQEILDLCHTYGLTVHAEDGHLHVSPRAKLTDDLRQYLQDNKEAVIALLAPISFENPRGQIKKLEKELGLDRPPPAAVVFLDRGGDGCDHEEGDVQMAIALLKQERMNRGYDTSQGFCFFLDALTKQECGICRVLKGQRS